MKEIKIEINQDELTEIICNLYDAIKYLEEKKLIFTAKRTRELIQELYQKRELAK